MKKKEERRSKMTKTGKRIFGVIACLLMSAAFICQVMAEEPVSGEKTLNPYGVQTSNPYVVRRFWENGKQIDEVIVPGRPPEVYRAPAVTPPEPNIAMGTNTLSNVPAFDWCFGCSATSAAMMMGHYDNSGYTNMYAGPTNGGVMPMDNSSWPDWVDSKGDTRHQCPLSATHKDLDGRTIRGHVDDYWIEIDDPGPDPFIGNWTEHTQGDCTADYMGTNQSLFSNKDGSTTFFWYTTGAPLYDYTTCEPAQRDGCHGLRLFVESRGYTVFHDGTNFQNYSQMIKGQGTDADKGFTFDDFKAEIDDGRPVLIQIEGHTMLGYGYNDTGEKIYIHDTWDYSDHEMTWGGDYSGMQHRAVTVLRLTAAPVYTVTFDTDPASTGTITFAGTDYEDDDTVDKVANTYDITANPGAGYEFSEWQKTGSLVIANPASATTTCTVNGSGTLKMVQAVETFAVTFDTVPADTGWIIFDGTDYDDGKTVNKPAATYTIIGEPEAGYTFSAWQTTGGLDVDDADSAATTCKVTGAGTLTMVQTATTFTDSDFDDTWNLFSVEQEKNDPENGWVYGPVTSKGDGTIAAGPGNELTKEDGTTAAVLATSTYTLNANGTIEVTLKLSTPGGPATLNIKGAMNSRKDVISLVSTMPDSSPDVYGAGTLIYKDSDTDAFDKTDFSGTWSLCATSQYEDAVTNGWIMGPIKSNGDETIAAGTTLTDEEGDTYTVAAGSTYTLNYDGTMTMTIKLTNGATIIARGAMNESKDVIGHVSTVDKPDPGPGPYDYGGGALVKNQATDFGKSDFKGTWRFYEVWQEEDDEENGWEYGTLISDGDGKITSGTYVDEVEETGSIPATSYALNANGFLTIPPAPATSRWGAMNDGLDVIAYVFTMSGDPGEPDEYGAGVMVYPSVAAAAAKDDDGGICFIATASYGTPMAEEVKALSAFRDEYLLTNKPGRTLISTYELISPPVADFIRDKEALKAIIRAGLKPLVKVADHLTSK